MKIAILSFLLALLGAASGTANAQAGDQPRSIDAQRMEVNLERERLEADFLNEEAICYRKFAVNSCLKNVNTKRREAMAELRRQEILLNDEDRKIKGAEQLRKTQEKSSPAKLQEAADGRKKTVEGYKARLQKEEDKQKVEIPIQSNEKTARDANAEKLLRHQKKIEARGEKQASAAEEAKIFNERQKIAQERRLKNEADQLKRGKSAAKPLPLPE
ncbi:MAG: hypothetical protein JWR60_1199 [Polaromonas sp.]|nr:hypothetical protein [Polaromonas sp.]